jgi:hypothetical protein
MGATVKALYAKTNDFLVVDIFQMFIRGVANRGVFGGTPSRFLQGLLRDMALSRW